VAPDAISRIAEAFMTAKPGIHVAIALLSCLAAACGDGPQPGKFPMGVPDGGSAGVGSQPAAGSGGGSVAGSSGGSDGWTGMAVAGTGVPDAGPPGVDAAPYQQPDIGVAASPPATDCSVILVSPVSPLVVDAAMWCEGTLAHAHVGALAGDAAYVSATAFAANGGFSSSTRLFRIGGATGPVTVQAPQGLRNATLLVDTAGSAHLAGTEVDGWSAVYYRPMDSGWVRETMPWLFVEEGIGIVDAAFLPDGRAVLVSAYQIGLYQRGSRLVIRGANGSYTDAPIPESSSIARVVVDASGRLQLVYVTSSGVPEVRQLPLGETVATKLAVSDPPSSFAVAPLADGRVVPALVTNVVDILVPQDEGDAVRIGVPDSKKLVTSGCAGEGPCTVTGKGSLGAVAMATTSDGDLWIAYIEATVDRDETWKCFLFEGFRTCSPTRGQDRSTTDLVLVRVSTKMDGFPMSVRWRARIGNDLAAPVVAMSARGTRLALAFTHKASPPPIDTGKTRDLRYVLLDTTKL
jgi:hypothetical protein